MLPDVPTPNCHFDPPFAARRENCSSVAAERLIAVAAERPVAVVCVRLFVMLLAVAILPSFNPRFASAFASWSVTSLEGATPLPLSSVKVCAATALLSLSAIATMSAPPSARRDIYWATIVAFEPLEGFEPLEWFEPLEGFEPLEWFEPPEWFEPSERLEPTDTLDPFKELEPTERLLFSESPVLSALFETAGLTSALS